MADKPRVKAPKQRTSTSRDPDRTRRLLGLGAAASGLVLGVVAVVAVVGLGGGDRPGNEEVRASLQAAGCSLQVEEPTLPPQGSWHTVDEPGGTSEEWATDPPTAGAHYGIPAIFGTYEEPLEQARVVHNLEHGGVYIQYGDDVPEATVDQLRDFYDEHQNGTLLAPLPHLGEQFALGAWVYEDELDKGYLAKCTSFDAEAVSMFFEAFQFRGPERFDPSQLQPGM
jgi:Protein of unknown function (DUF3105)